MSNFVWLMLDLFTFYIPSAKADGNEFSQYNFENTDNTGSTTIFVVSNFSAIKITGYLNKGTNFIHY